MPSPFRLIAAVCLALGSGAPVARATALRAPLMVRGGWSTLPQGVTAVQAPAPTDTLHITGAPWRNVAGTGQAYVDLAPGHAALFNPVIVIEGFDLDNTMGWNELYAELNQQNLLETLRGEGFDVVVLDFTDATDDIERNAFVFTALLQQVEDAIPPSNSVGVVGASMGALVARYGLAWLESHAVSMRVRTWISFDGPHEGANIPLGVQYWLDFFSGLSSDAAYLVGRLNRPAAREMLVYHFTQPPASVPVTDTVRTRFLADLADAGGFPHGPRSVAISNGSGLGLDQGFAPGAQLIQYDYNVFPFQFRGNVWALPDGSPPDTVFDGRSLVLFPPARTETVIASGTLPYDGAPGGWRATMLQMDTTQTQYGDVVALHPAHCFVPTLSALAIPSTSLFAPVATNAALRAQSPFDTVYVPADNQEHVAVTAENAQWIRRELEAGVLGVAGTAAIAAVRLGPAMPQPSSGEVRIAFALPRAGRVRLTVLDVAGREVARLWDGVVEAGMHTARWNGRTAEGGMAPAGIYFVRLVTDERRTASARLVRMP
jgi:flagellar hook capping protein FlgD